MIKVIAVITLILLILTMGCGFTIYYGGEAFQRGIKGHMVLGILTLLSFIALLVKIYRMV